MLSRLLRPLLTAATACSWLALTVGCGSTPDCADGTVADGDTCVPEACGVGTWGDLPVDGDTVFVDAASAAGGDGSETAPLTSIQAGLDLAGNHGGGLVAVAAGTYGEALVLGHDHAGVRLAGRCAELVTVDAAPVAGKATIGIEAEGTDEITVEGVTVTGSRGDPTDVSRKIGGIVVLGGRATLRALIVADNDLHGIVVRGEHAALEAEEVAIRGTAFHWALMADQDAGVYAADGAVVHLAGGRIEGNETRGVLVEGEADATLSDLRIEGNGARSLQGRGIHVRGGARLAARDVSLVGNHQRGLEAGDEGTVVVLEDVEVADTLPDADGRWGQGLRAHDGARLEVTSSVLRGNHRRGLIARDLGTVVILDQVEILDTQRDADSTVAIGMTIQDRGELIATDVTVEGTEGPGIYVWGFAELYCTRCTLRGSTFAGATVLQARLELTSSTIEDTTPDPQFGGGVGIYQEFWAGWGALVVEQSTIGEHPVAAVWLDGPGSAALRENDLHGGPQVEALPGVWTHGDVVCAMGGMRTWGAGGYLGLLLESNSFHGAQGAAVFLDRSSATLSGNTFEDNEVDLWQQHCDETTPVEGAGEAPVQEIDPENTRINLPLDFQIYLRDDDV